MKRVIVSILIFTIAFFSIGAYVYFQSARKGSDKVLAQPLKSEGRLPEGAYIYKESKFGSEKDAWRCTLYLPPKLYSKETLESIFRWYAQKHPDETTDLYMGVFTNKDTMEFYATRSFTDGGGINDQLGATYFRSHILDSRGEVNEYYTYSPENNYYRYENVYGVNLRGCPDFLPEPIKKWSSKNIGVEIQVSCVISKYSPSKYYYQLYCNNFSEGTAVLSVYHPNADLQPEKNLYFLNDGKIYFYFGWKFAISLDNGKTWNVWSADRKLRDFQTEEYDLIKNAVIEKNGTGKMELNRNNKSNKLTLTLVTKDYGQHWQPE